MAIILIDLGALALFLGYMAIVYWHGVSHESQPGRRRLIDRARPAGPHCPDPGVPEELSAYFGRDSARTRSARSSVEIDQRSSQLMQ